MKRLSKEEKIQMLKDEAEIKSLDKRSNELKKRVTKKKVTGFFENLLDTVLDAVY